MLYKVRFTLGDWSGDGHGGKEVSGYAAKHFKDLLLKSENFTKNKSQALIDAFLAIDNEMQLSRNQN